MSASLQSDHRYRGRSLSEDRPTAGLNVFYDHASGAYAGGSITAVDTARYGVRLMEHVEYLGYARRLPRRGPAWEIGATNTQVSYYRTGKRTARYNEVYLGLLGDHASLHVYYSPSYFGGGLNTVYADLSGAFKPAPEWRLYGHAGVLTPVAGPVFPGSRHERYDVSAGIARRIGKAELSLAVSGVSPNRAYLSGRILERNAVTFGAAYFF